MARLPAPDQGAARAPASTDGRRLKPFGALWTGGRWPRRSVADRGRTLRLPVFFWQTESPGNPGVGHVRAHPFSVRFPLCRHPAPGAFAPGVRARRPLWPHLFHGPPALGPGRPARGLGPGRHAPAPAQCPGRGAQLPAGPGHSKAAGPVAGRTATGPAAAGPGAGPGPGGRRRAQPGSGGRGPGPARAHTGRRFDRHLGQWSLWRVDRRGGGTARETRRAARPCARPCARPPRPIWPARAALPAPGPCFRPWPEQDTST